MGESDSKGKAGAILGIVATVFSLIGGIYGGYQWYASERDSYNLNGQWRFDFTIQQSSMRSYVGMSAGYKIYVEQNGKSVHGIGAKWWVNNQIIPYAQHDKLEFNGTIKDGVLTATYSLYGKVATTSGGFNAKIKNDEQLGGTYAGTAADTRGNFVANKEVQQN